MAAVHQAGDLQLFLATLVTQKNIQIMLNSVRVDCISRAQ
jgi:hypothetical protein